MHTGSYDCRRLPDNCDDELLQQIGDFSIRYYPDGSLGGFAINLPNADGVADLNWIPVHREKETPKFPTSWTWDGNEDKPTLKPSILFRKDHWHGYLKAGRLESC